MVDRLFSDAELAALYDAWWQGHRKDFDFYLPLVMSAEAVLDAGCGTGTLLHQAREFGHRGRLCGLDPAPGMLAQARKWRDIEWVLGDLTSIAYEHEFDLVVTTGHAFQVLIMDDEIRKSLAAIRRTLTNNGRFAFETRNPLARAWESWTPENAVEVTDRRAQRCGSPHSLIRPLMGGPSPSPTPSPAPLGPSRGSVKAL
jgi:ubiquinone/menaquinone biosynthesis C-methylase UbiE